MRRVFRIVTGETRPLTLLTITKERHCFTCRAPLINKNAYATDTEGGVVLCKRCYKAYSVPIKETP